MNFASINDGLLLVHAAMTLFMVGVIGQRVSPACYIAEAFPASLYLAWKYAGDFEAGILANVNLGGDNCHRGAVVGALLGAAADTDLIPARFRDGLHDASALRQTLDSLPT